MFRENHSYFLFISSLSLHLKIKNTQLTLTFSTNPSETTPIEEPNTLENNCIFTWSSVENNCIIQQHMPKQPLELKLQLECRSKSLTTLTEPQK
ncbi:hypothetical protein LINPERPRIM_LOCUS19734 [Linum perenne]